MPCVCHSPNRSEEKLANVLVAKPENLLSVRKKSNPFVDLPAPDPQAPVFKQGMLCRKVHADIDGKKSKYSPSVLVPAFGHISFSKVNQTSALNPILMVFLAMLLSLNEETPNRYKEKRRTPSLVHYLQHQ